MSSGNSTLIQRNMLCPKFFVEQELGIGADCAGHDRVRNERPHQVRDDAVRPGGPRPAGSSTRRDLDAAQGTRRPQPTVARRADERPLATESKRP